MPADRERDRRRPGHRLPRRARPGEDPDGAAPRRPARRVAAGRPRRRAQRRPVRRRSARPAGPIVDEHGDATPIDWLPRDRRYAEKLATPDITIADLIGEVDPIRVAEGRYLSDELTLHYGLIPRANRGHLRDQRAAGPRRADPGRPAQHPRGARRPDPRLHGPPAARPVRRRVAPTPRTTRAAAGSSRRSRTASGRRSGRTTRGRSTHELAIVRQEKQRFDAARRRAGVAVPGVHGRAPRRADPPRPPLAGDQPALGRQRPGHGRERRGPRGGRAPAGRPARRVAWPRRASPTWARSSPRRSARSSWSRSATRRPRSGSSSG